MVKDFEEANKKLKQHFPKLAKDKRFIPTSNQNRDYNCIAWAMRLCDRWVDIAQTAGHWWPFQLTSATVIHHASRQGLINAFRALKFVECDNDTIEKNYDKVALYYNPATSYWSHAARVIGPNEYHSKIGGLWDIHHSDGDVMNNPILGPNNYGLVYQIMKRKKIYRLYSMYLSAVLIFDKIGNEIRCLL